MTAVATNNKPTSLQQIFEFGGTCTIKGLSKVQFKQPAIFYPSLQMEREKNGTINIMIMASVKEG